MTKANALPFKYKSGDRALSLIAVEGEASKR